MKNIYITTQITVNSDGLYFPAISIYFSGCDKKIKCKNCHNPELQKKGCGIKTNYKQVIEDIEKDLKELLNIYPKISLCYLGGEALAPWNRESTYEISKYFKNKYKNKICNIIYTWRYIEDLKQLSKEVSYMNLGVLGDFEEDLKIENRVPASTNQYIYDFNNNIKIEPIIKEEK